MSSTRTTLGVAQTGTLRTFDWIALILLIVGGLNWGLIGFFNIDVVAYLFGFASTASRVVYSVVGVAAFYAIFLCMRVCRRMR